MGCPDARGNPEAIPGSEQVLDANAVILAFDFRPSPAAWFAFADIKADNYGLVIAPAEAACKFQSGNAKVFASGDMVRGSDLVEAAIWEGRQAAEVMLDYLDL